MLSGLLTCGSCGGSFGVVSQAKKAGATYRTLGCVTHKSRGTAICPNSQTISERKVSGALLSYLQDKFTHPDRVQKLIEDFQGHLADAVKAGGDPVKELDNQIARQRKTVQDVTTALVSAPTSQGPWPSALASRRRSWRSWRASGPGSSTTSPGRCLTLP